MQCFLSVRLVYGRIHPYVQSRTRPRPPIRIRPAFYAALWCSFLLAYAPNMTDEIESEYFPQCAEDIFWADRKRVQTLIDLYCIKSSAMYGVQTLAWRYGLSHQSVLFDDAWAD